VGTEDNFFDLGGDPSSAAELFSEIHRALGRKLAPVTICYTPTISTLACTLNKPTTPQIPPLVLLKSGGDKAPVFITHGLGATVLDLFQLAKHLVSPGPIYGLQMRGMDGSEEPFDRVEEMARYFLNAIRQRQSQGPYFLIGYSLGGLVMLEIAQRLLRDKQKVALLALVETYPYVKRLPILQRVRQVLRMTNHHASMILRLPAAEALSYITSASSRRKHGIGDLRSSEDDRHRAGLFLNPAIQRMRDSSYEALKHYRPRFYPAKLNLIKATQRIWFLPLDPNQVWHYLAESLAIDIVPGDHFGILTTYVEDLASVLSRQLLQASASVSGQDAA
jgi:acetoacetyl-CoA synthetase